MILNVVAMKSMGMAIKPKFTLQGRAQETINYSITIDNFATDSEECFPQNQINDTFKLFSLDFR